MKQRNIHSSIFAIVLSLTLGCQKRDSSPAAVVKQVQPEQATNDQNPIKICTFNIQFLGNFELRDNDSLANILREAGCTIVTIQELVAPPDLRVLKGSAHYQAPTLPYFPQTEKRYQPKETVTKFFLSMEKVGFEDFILSDEDTGTSATIHNNGSQTEWWVTFYRADQVQVATDLPMGFLAEDRSGHPEIDRVPYAVPFRTLSGHTDFVLISVHLRPGPGKAHKARRQQELSFIDGWIQDQEKISSERDFIVLGDMNIEDGEELKVTMPMGYVSLNTDALFMTNTNLSGPKPYDHVMIRPAFTTEVAVESNFKIIDLIRSTQRNWRAPFSFPGEPYIHNLFRMHFSDHHPILFDLTVPEQDDD